MSARTMPTFPEVRDLLQQFRGVRGAVLTPNIRLDTGGRQDVSLSISGPAGFADALTDGVLPGTIQLLRSRALVNETITETYKWTLRPAHDAGWAVLQALGDRALELLGQGGTSRQQPR